MKKNEIIKKEFNELIVKLKLEIRDTLNGHDLLEKLFLYINKIKNTPNFKKENFQNVVMLTADSSMLEVHNLFKTTIESSVP